MSQISRSQFASLAESLVGQEVSHAWKGMGPAIFLEFGELSTEKKRRQAEGEFTIRVEWSWRVESNDSVLIGSFCSGPEISKFVASFVGTQVTAIEMTQPIPELIVSFSAGFRLHTFTTISGSPQWSAKFPHRRYIAVDGASIVQLDDSPTERAEDEDIYWEHAEMADERWSRQVPVKSIGACEDCAYFIRLDGSCHFLDYGCCSNPDSEFDGRVVDITSGCECFSTDLTVNRR